MSTLSNATDAISDGIRDAAANIGDGVRARIDDLGSRIADFTNQAQRRVSDVGERAMDTASDMRKSSRRAVKDHPLTAVAIGLAFGWIVGRLMRPRRRWR